MLIYQKFSFQCIFKCHVVIFVAKKSLLTDYDYHKHVAQYLLNIFCTAMKPFKNVSMQQTVSLTTSTITAASSILLLSKEPLKAIPLKAKSTISFRALELNLLSH